MTNQKRKLKAALVLEYGSQVEAATAFGWSESRLSRLINGWNEPRPEEARLIYEKLGVEVAVEEMNAH